MAKTKDLSSPKLESHSILSNEIEIEQDARIFKVFAIVVVEKEEGVVCIAVVVNSVVDESVVSSFLSLQRPHDFGQFEARASTWQYAPRTSQVSSESAHSFGPVVIEMVVVVVVVVVDVVVVVVVLMDTLWQLLHVRGQKSSKVPLPQYFFNTLQVLLES